MKFGRTLMELAQELTRQREAKHDYLIDTRNLVMDATPDGGHLLTMQNPQQRQNTLLTVHDSAPRQIGATLGIPAKYYDKMRTEHPELLTANVNGWFQHAPQTRMVRTLDGTARAFLSDRYRRIDNAEIAEAVLPIIADIQDARVESCEVTDERMYIKVVNPRRHCAERHPDYQLRGRHGEHGNPAAGVPARMHERHGRERRGDPALPHRARQ